jgi:transposase
MKEILERCAGLDVHQRTVVACIMIGNEGNIKKEIQTFGTTTRQLSKLAHWLISFNIKDAAIESTGIYWIPVYVALESNNLKPIVANAHHIKTLPGKKTDVKDAEWICNLFKCGLIKASFIPSKEIRNLRNLTRQRKKYVQQKNTSLNRIIKTLESCGIKLKSIVSTIEAKSSWNIINAIANGITDPTELSKQVTTKISVSKEELIEAITGFITTHEITMIKIFIGDVNYFDDRIKEMDSEIIKAQQCFTTEIELIKTFPGIADTTASVIISEIGTNMNQFPTEDHLASWAGLVPGNNESAGKTKSSRILPGNKHLKVSLLQCAWVAIREKNGYWTSIYYRLKAKLGARKAIIAIARRILTKIYLCLKFESSYEDLKLKIPNEQVQKSIEYYKKKLNELETKIV